MRPLKRFTLFFVLLITSLACRFSSVNMPPTNDQPQTQNETATSASVNNHSTLLYISGTTHIESKPETWPDVDTYLAFLQQVTMLGMKWSVGADVGWLEGEPRAAELIQASEALGIQWDVHAHNPQDRAKAAYLITQMGGHPNTVISGMLISEFDSMRQPLTYQGFTWTPKVLWGGVNCPGHRPGCDDLAAGIWIPLSAEQYTTHDPNGTLIRVGGGTHQLDDGRALAQAVANGQYPYPIISFTVMVGPVELTIPKTNDGITELAVFVEEMNKYPFIRWATIEETAQAWVEAGGIPSRIEME